MVGFSRRAGGGRSLLVVGWTLPIDGRSCSVEDAEANAAHEGAHAGEITPGTPTWNQRYAWEHDAYETESYFSQSIGFKDMRAPLGGQDMVNGVLDLSRDYVLWNPSWANVNAATVSDWRSKGIDAVAKDTADYSCSRGGCKK